VRWLRLHLILEGQHDQLGPRAEFEEAWERLKPTRTEAHYELYRRSRDFHSWKNRMHDERLKLPTQATNDRARCFCGADGPAEVQCKVSPSALTH
jgi:hypothetical protein